MMARKSKQFRWQLAIATSLLAGCVTNPGTDNEFYFVDVPAKFEGYAQAPSHRLDIYAYNKNTLKWDYLKTVTSGTSSIEFGGETLYPWQTTVTLRDYPNAYCYLHPRCTPFDGTVKFQVREPGSRLDVLATHRFGTLDCTQKRVLQRKEGLQDAYEQCRPVNWNVVEAYFWPYCVALKKCPA